MSLPAAVQWGLIGVILVGGIALERRLAGREPLVSVPDWTRMILGGLALGGPWVLHAEGLLATAVVDDAVVALALSAVLWLAATRVVGVGAGGGGPRGSC